MKKKYMIAIVAVVTFASIATAFALQAGGKDAPIASTESATSSSVSLTIGEINSTGLAGEIAGSASGSGVAATNSTSAGDKNTRKI